MTAEQFIKDYTRTDSNELIAIEDIHGKKVISYREWLTPEQALRAVELGRENLWHPATEKPDSPHGLIVMTDWATSLKQSMRMESSLSPQ